MRKFVNSMGFFRSSIPNYAEKTFELLNLITESDPTKKKHKKFALRENHQRLFNELKEAARNYLPLYEIDPNKPLYAFSDASKRSVGFVCF